jgi:hypothetical protein
MKRLLLTFIVGTFGASVAAESYVCVTDQATGFKYARAIKSPYLFYFGKAK